MTDAQLREAKALWAEGKTFGEIARTVGVRVEDLHPLIGRENFDLLRKATEWKKARLAWFITNPGRKSELCVG